MTPNRPNGSNIWIVPAMLVSVTLMALSLTLAFSQSSYALKILGLKSYIDDIDYFHVVGEIENDRLL